MSRADTGGFDLVLALSPQYLAGLAGQHLPSTITKTVGYDKATFLGVDVHAHMSLTCTLGLAVSNVIVVPAPTWGDGPTISISVAATTSWTWDDVTVCGDVIVKAGQWPPAGAPVTPMVVMTASARLTTSGQDVVVNAIKLTVTVPPGGLEQIPGVAGLLAALRTIPAIGTGAANDASTWLYSQLPGLLNSGLAAAVPDHVHVVALPAAVTVLFGVALTQSSDVVVMIALTSGDFEGMPPGLFPVIRSPIRHASDGTAKDLVGLVVGNYWLLRHGVRPGMAKALSLDDAHFSSFHPCCWSGSKDLTSTLGISISLTSLLAQIDMNGAFTLNGSIAGQDPAGGVHVTGTFSVGARLTTDTRTMTLTMLAPQVSLSDSVAWWVWVAAGLTGGSTALIATAVTQAVASGALAGTVSNALASKVPASVTVTIPDVGILPVVISTTQPDAEWQYVDGPVQGVLPPVSRCNDVILALDAS